MAEFALGLTNSAVAGTVSRVKSAIEEEVDIKERVQEDLQFITGEFQMMQSFLRGANTADRAAKNQVVRMWVKQLRDLAFDVEDCVEFIVHLDSPPWTNWLWRVLPSCCKEGAPPLPLDEAVAEIKRLKARVVDVSLRNTRYNVMTDSTTMAYQQEMLPALATATASSSSSAAAFHILKEVWHAAGKLHGTNTCLKHLLCDDGNELQVVSLWPGSRSTGADLHRSELSCIIREAYNDPKIHGEFECCAWVKLTAGSFNIEEFLNSLIAQFCSSLSARSQLAAAGSKAELMQQVNSKRYLLVIQGISTMDEWDAIKMYMPNNYNGSRIIVSAQQLRPAILCTRYPYKVSELARFSNGQSLCAFSKVSQTNDPVPSFALFALITELNTENSKLQNPSVCFSE
uniref:Uncharacterized protein n=1 Tax=Avena sativa TaxID=4498 RepID=A0ACD5UHB7_AVESA